MKKISWQYGLGIILAVLSATFYLIHYAVFHDTQQILLYLIGDIAFLPVEVLFVTLILHRLLAEREKALMLRKLNMVIGAFYSEVGTPLLGMLVNIDIDMGRIQKSLLINSDWDERKFNNAVMEIMKYDYGLEITTEQVVGLKQYMIEKRNFLLRLLENPNLLEHESFTQLLWAVFHLTEELAARKSISKELKSDFEHIVCDLERVYKLLTVEWIAYMQHLKNDYPHLYSFAVRTNPFDPDAVPEIT